MKIEAKSRSLVSEYLIRRRRRRYIGYVRVGNVLYIGGNIGRINSVIKYRGKSVIRYARTNLRRGAQCGLNHIATMKAALRDLDNVERIVKVIGWSMSRPVS
jgi:hypothetical protein